MSLPDITARCGNCLHGEEKIQVTYCLSEDVLEALKQSPNVLLHGCAGLITSPNSHCRCFAPSAEALDEAEALEKEELHLRGEAGRSYPASLSGSNNHSASISGKGGQ